MGIPDIQNLTLLELLFVLISLPGMIFIAALVSDGVRNLVRGERLNPTGEKLGNWLRNLTPFQLQWVVIAAQVFLPLLAYIALSVWVDAALRDIEQGYRFVRDLIIAVAVGKAYYQLTKPRPQSVVQYVISNNITGEPSTDQKIEDLISNTSLSASSAGHGPIGLHVFRGMPYRRLEAQRRAAHNEAVMRNLTAGDPMRRKKTGS
jgi:hypothetical protein